MTQVTAHDFWSVLYELEVPMKAEQYHSANDVWEDIIETIYAQARREALKEMDEAHVANEKAYQAFRMNGRCEPWASEGVKAQEVVIKLRQEYQQPA